MCRSGQRWSLSVVDCAAELSASGGGRNREAIEAGEGYVKGEEVAEYISHSVVCVSRWSHVFSFSLSFFFHFIDDPLFIALLESQK